MWRGCVARERHRRYPQSWKDIRTYGTAFGTAVLANLPVAVFAGFLEEVVFRGLFFRLMQEWLGTWIALVLAAVLFGAMHLANPMPPCGVRSPCRCKRASRWSRSTWLLATSGWPSAPMWLGISGRVPSVSRIPASTPTVSGRPSCPDRPGSPAAPSATSSRSSPCAAGRQWGIAFLVVAVQRYRIRPFRQGTVVPFASAGGTSRSSVGRRG
ncbi:CPBP family intramembrane glutamic endopeptidase [Nocardia sp. NPDC004604]|uniref:CPBP family intramembrane glutamic endopeptidase n=1 Tax=Nocardia sp. NPDC004604 TaxID=3157013 RepID=UPI0033A61148